MAGLYSKFSVKRDGKSLKVGSFVLVPFKEDGSVNDTAAVAALQVYADLSPSDELSQDIRDWIKNPKKYEHINAQ